MSKKYLAIVEGEDMEPEILEYALSTYYGFNVLRADNRLSSLPLGFKKTLIYDGNDEFYIVQGRRNRIKELLKETLEETHSSIERAFSNENFAGIFLVYDVDHNSNEEIEEARGRFNNISDGLLTLSVPCVECVLEKDFKPYVSSSYKGYKTAKNEWCTEQAGVSSKEFIKYEFNRLMIENLLRNKKVFAKESLPEPNDVSLHGEYSLDLNARYNIRTGRSEKDYRVEISYYASVLYLILLHVKGHARYSDSFDSLLAFFYSKQREIEKREEGIALDFIGGENLSLKNLESLAGGKGFANYLLHKFSRYGFVRKENGKEREGAMSPKEIKDFYEERLSSLAV